MILREALYQSDKKNFNYHYTIYAIILIGVHRTADPLMLNFIDY